VIAFHFHELDRSEVVGLIDILERFTRRTFEATRREMASALEVHDLEPWDLDLGFTRLGELPATALRDPLGALREQAGRWGFDGSTFPEVVEAPDLILEAWPVWIEVPRQARVLLRPGHDWDTVRAHFRAFGAALHGLNIGSRRHFLEQDSAVMMEATGRIFEGVLDDPEWLAEHTGADRPAILRHLVAARGRRILNLRRHAALTAFENLAYAASELEPQRLYADVMEHMLQETRRPEAAWTAHPDPVFRPFAHGAALVGAMIAAQTRVTLCSVPERQWAAWLRAHYLEMGARDSVDARVERATGSPPALPALATELGVDAEVPLLGAEEGISEDALAEYFKDIDLSDLD
jgi:hypothetical protein